MQARTISSGAGSHTPSPPAARLHCRRRPCQQPCRAEQGVSGCQVGRWVAPAQWCVSGLCAMHGRQAMQACVHAYAHARNMQACVQAYTHARKRMHALNTQACAGVHACNANARMQAPCKHACAHARRRTRTGSPWMSPSSRMHPPLAVAAAAAAAAGAAAGGGCCWPRRRWWRAQPQRRPRSQQRQSPSSPSSAA